MDSSKINWPGWETVRLIGRGSFGAVYEIQRQVRGRTEHAALKVISIPKGEEEILSLRANDYDDESITRYFADNRDKIEDEYAVMADMKGHANIVYCDDIRTVQHSDGFGWDIFIKMELLTPMKKYFHAEVPEEQVIRVGVDICNALVACKTRNIVHRDIKPDNIFVSWDGNFKLGDFGIARTMENTTMGTFTGTYEYMAPEIYQHQPYNSSADIYSLGLVMYWLLNGRTAPFLKPSSRRPTPSDLAMAREQRFTGKPLPAPVNGSRELQQIVLKACAYDSHDRYESPAEMKEDLEALLFGRIPPEESEGTVREEDIPLPDEEKTICVREEQAEKHGEAPKAEQSGRKKKEKKPRRKRRKIGWIALALVVLCVGTGYGLVRLGVVDMQSEAVQGVTGRVTDACAYLLDNSPIGGLHIHSWQAATCERPETCAECGKTRGEPAGHVYSAATYGMPERCTTCKKLNGTILGRTIAAGLNHTVGIRSDRKVIATGDDFYRQCDVEDWREVVAVSAGTYHTIGLRSDGTVVATGRNTGGVCNVEDWTDMVAVDTAITHTVGLRSDGTVMAVGANEKGECNTRDWRDIVSVAAGRNFTIGLKADGTVIAAGLNSDGQCNVAGWRNVVAIAAGEYYSVGLKADGTIYTAGQLTNGRDEATEWTDIVAIDAGQNTILGLKSDGTVISTHVDGSFVYEGEEWQNVVAISAGEMHVAAMKADGRVVTDGRDTQGQGAVSGWRNMRVPK